MVKFGWKEKGYSTWLAVKDMFQHVPRSLWKTGRHAGAGEEISVLADH